MNHVWQRSRSKGRARLVLLALADMANDDGECWPGKSNLAAKCNMDLRNVLLIINKLQADGELSIVHRRSGKISLPNRYRIHMGTGDQEIGSDLLIGSDQEIVGGTINRSWGSDQEIVGGSDQEIVGGTIRRSPDPLKNPLKESLSDPESDPPTENAIQKMLRERREQSE
jgi:hypothetical protein